jgi:hypothetical protein
VGQEPGPLYPLRPLGTFRLLAPLCRSTSPFLGGTFSRLASRSGVACWSDRVAMRRKRCGRPFLKAGVASLIGALVGLKHWQRIAYLDDSRGNKTASSRHVEDEVYLY